MKYLLEEKRLFRVREHLYLVHRGLWPVPVRPMPVEKLDPPRQLIGMGTVWKGFAVRPGEAQLKEAAILTYRTQTRVAGNTLLSYVRASELVGEYPAFKIPRVNGAEPSGSTLAIRDPAGDLAGDNIQSSGDITGVYSYVGGKDWVLKLAAVTPVKDDVSYRIHARLFPVRGLVRRFDITYYKRRLSLPVYAANSMAVIPGIRTDEVNGYWRVKIPVSSIRGIRAVFLNADTSLGPFGIDKTAWRMLELYKGLLNKSGTSAGKTHQSNRKNWVTVPIKLAVKQVSFSFRKVCHPLPGPA